MGRPLDSFDTGKTWTHRYLRRHATDHAEDRRSHQGLGGPNLFRSKYSTSLSGRVLYCSEPDPPENICCEQAREENPPRHSSRGITRLGADATDAQDCAKGGNPARFRSLRPDRPHGKGRAGVFHEMRQPAGSATPAPSGRDREGSSTAGAGSAKERDFRLVLRSKEAGIGRLHIAAVDQSGMVLATAIAGCNGYLATVASAIEAISCESPA